MAVVGEERKVLEKQSVKASHEKHYKVVIDQPDRHREQAALCNYRGSRGTAIPLKWALMIPRASVES